MVDKLKAYYIVDDNGKIEDLIVGQEDEESQVAQTTLDYIQKRNDTWLKYRIVELKAEGVIHKGHINIVTTIKMSGMPIRTILNNFYNIIEIIENYMKLENDYRHYSYYTEYIKL
jgi:hypothetical protein